MSDNFVQLPPMRFEDHDVRFLIEAEDEEWLRAEDACACMGIENVTNALARLRPHHKRQFHIMNATGKPRPIWFINEPGFYKLALTSRKPEAERFQVLPPLSAADRRQDRYHP